MRWLSVFLLSFSRSLLPQCFMMAEINCKYATLQPPGSRNTSLELLCQAGLWTLILLMAAQHFPPLLMGWLSLAQFFSTMCRGFLGLVILEKKVSVKCKQVFLKKLGKPFHWKLLLCLPFGEAALSLAVERTFFISSFKISSDLPKIRSLENFSSRVHSCTVRGWLIHFLCTVSRI